MNATQRKKPRRAEPRSLRGRVGVKPGKGWRPRLTIKEILAWADDHHRRTGQWPVVRSGRIRGSSGDTWIGVNLALSTGARGLPGGESLSKLLVRHRGSAASKRGCKLTVEKVLAWADEHRRRTGKWPAIRSGSIPKVPRESWKRIDSALRGGWRGLGRKSSLAKLLNEHRNREGESHLSVREILAWADAHRRRTGEWPTTQSGPIREAPGRTWKNINVALTRGSYGLPGGDSLAQCLTRYRGKRNPRALPPYTRQKILRWADAHIRRTGRRPTSLSGPIPQSAGDNWSSVDRALSYGHRGLAGGSSLSRFLKQHGRKNLRTRKPKKAKSRIRGGLRR